MRTILLWMARNPWLRARLPRLRFVRRAVRSFMPGEDLGSATAAASACRDDGIKAAFTRLGENLTDLGEAGAVADHYVEVLDEIERLGLDGEISIKLTQLGYDLDVETAYGHFDRIARRAAEVGTWAWVDMEGSAYVEGTIAFYERAGRPMTTSGCASRRISTGPRPTSSGCSPSGPGSGWSRAPTTSRRPSPTAPGAMSTPPSWRSPRPSHRRSAMGRPGSWPAPTTLG